VAFEAGKPLTIESPGTRWSRSRQPGLPYRRLYPPVLIRRSIPGDSGTRGCRYRFRVTSLKQGDRVIPLYPRMPSVRILPEPQDQSLSSNPLNQGAGNARWQQSVLSRGTMPITMGTFANYTVLPEIAVAKIHEDAPFDKVCYIAAV